MWPVARRKEVKDNNQNSETGRSLAVQGLTKFIPVTEERLADLVIDMKAEVQKGLKSLFDSKNLADR